jgi:predicted MFS family arabinose efflux permease
MRLAAYKEVLALPGVRALMLLALFARLPVVAAGITLTLHVVEDLGGSYSAAGAVGAVFTVASAIGAPLLGRLVDRRSLRLVLAISISAEAVFWAAAPSLSYGALLLAGAPLGLLTLPVFSVVRQSIAALVPAAQRRQAYALDSMGVELSFMVGPALAVLMVTRVSAVATMYAVGAAIVLAGVGLYVMDPPVRADDEEAGTARVPRRAWFGPRFIALLTVAAATTAVLAATDIALVAELRAAGQVAWVGLVLAAWGGYSLVGGFVYGAVRRAVPTVVLLALLGAFTIPVGLVDGALWLAIVLVPAGAVCAPTLASAADAISRLVPAGARGEAMGLHGSALTLGLASGAPLAGLIIDAHGPAWGFAVVGAIGLSFALVLLPFAWRITPPSGHAPGEETAAASAWEQPDVPAGAPAVQGSR